MPRLLAVDDEPAMLDFLERVFRRDYEVVRSTSVAGALEALAASSFDIIVTDRRMPHRSGVELVEIAAARYPSAVRVLLIGYADSLADENMALWPLIDAWVQKPIDSVRLRRAVAEAVERRKAIAKS